MATGSAPTEATLRLALELHHEGDFGAATAIYRALLQTQPSNAQIWGLLGSACRMKGNAEEAVRTLQKAVDFAPERADLKAEFGIALSEAGRHGEAADLLDALLPTLRAEDQDAGVVYAALADACLGLNRLEEAVMHYRTAILKEPENTAAAVNLGTALQQLGRLEEAIEVYEKAVREDSSDVPALTNLGIALNEANRGEDSLPVLKCAAALSPDDAGVRGDLGLVLHKLGRHDDAEAAFNKALAADPGHGRCWSNLGNLLQERHKLADARMAHECALAIDAEDPDFHWNHAMTLLLDGALAKGFSEYEWRRRKPGFGRPPVVAPDWDGSDPRGKTILLYTEQGIGDAIQFSRYAPMLTHAGASVILAAPKTLAPVLATMGGAVEVVSRLDAARRYDCHAPLLSMPHYMRTTPETIPAIVPYLAAPHGTPSPLPPPSGRVRAGLVWAGNPDHPNDANRSTALDPLTPLIEIGTIEWISLQVGDAAGDIGRTGLPVLDLAPRLDSFADTAAAIAGLDLVVSIDTAVAHLAGAMGCPVWLLLPHAPDWRWQLGRSDSPWYPSMRLFRQPAPGDWGSVIDSIRLYLQAQKAG